MSAGEFAPGGFGKVQGRSGQFKLGVDLLRRTGDEWPEEHGEDAAAFSEVVEHFVETRGLGRIFRQLERGGLIDVLVRAVHESPDAFEGSLELVGAEMALGFPEGFYGVAGKFVMARGHDAVAVALGKAVGA